MYARMLNSRFFFESRTSGQKTNPLVVSTSAPRGLVSRTHTSRGRPMRTPPLARCLRPERGLKAKEILMSWPAYSGFRLFVLGFLESLTLALHVWKADWAAAPGTAAASMQAAAAARAAVTMEIRMTVYG